MATALKPVESGLRLQMPCPSGGGTGGRVHQRPRVHVDAARHPANEATATNDVCGRDGAVRTAERGDVWTTSDYDGAVCELPPGAWKMPKSMTGTEALKWLWAFGSAIAARGKSTARDGGATPTGAPLLRSNHRGAYLAAGKGMGSALMQPTLR